MLKRNLAALALISTQVHAASQAHTGELLYQFKDTKSTSTGLIKQFELKSATGSIAEVLKPSDKQTRRGTLEQLREDMLKTGAFKFVEFNTLESEASFPASDAEKQWHHRTISSDLAWDYTVGTNDVIVAVCDSGVQVDHEDMKGRVMPGWSLIENRADNTTTTAHGTFVGGLIAAHVGNELGGAGVASGVRILPLRISNSSGSTSMKLITDCIKMAADRGAKVINVSFTGIESQIVQEAGKYAADKGALLVYAAGNQGKNRSVKSYPDYTNVFAIGATNASDKRWTYRKGWFSSGGSNYGQFIDVVAPGHNLYSTNVYSKPTTERYRSGSGTSYAAPLAAAVAALVYSVNPKFTPKQVENIIVDSADKIGEANVYGAGRVNALAAVRLAKERSR
jgi:subtilisin family serine protease